MAKTEKTTVKYIYCVSVNYPYSISKYRCLSCRAGFLDMDGDYVFCPYCGRRIVKTVKED